jgi:hypothetical protein
LRREVVAVEELDPQVRMMGVSSMALICKICTHAGKANARLVAPFADDRWEEAVGSYAEEVNADAREPVSSFLVVGVAMTT